MRTYRGKTKDGSWVYGNLIIHNAEESDGIHKAEPLKTYIQERVRTWISKTADKCWRHLSFEVIPETVGQSTGLCDKNHQEIYQGDILNPGRREVRFGEYDTKLEQGTGFTTFSHDAEPPWDRPFSFATRQAEGSEIIGTIHDEESK